MTFLPEGFGNGPALVERIKGGKTPISRIICVGQGTAAVAAMAVATLLRRTLKGSSLSIESYTGSELIGFLGDERMDDVFLIPVSQSGTTTDTNRVVDLCRDRGAWVNCIVNRRNSPLVQKSDSYIYTSNGRDVEMAVASTKAFYSQVAAGKLLSLWLADVLGTLDRQAILADIESLEALPDQIDKVLAGKEAIGEVAKNMPRSIATGHLWATEQLHRRTGSTHQALGAVLQIHPLRRHRRQETYRPFHGAADSRHGK